MENEIIRAKALNDKLDCIILPIEPVYPAVI